MLLFSKKFYKNKTEEELVELIQKDDFTALEELIKRVQNSVYASFYYLSNNCEDILDMTQDALLKMAKNIKNLKDPLKFRPWLNQIVTRLFYDYVRSKSRKPDTIPLEQKIDNETDKFNISEVPCKTCTPEENSLNSELTCLIDKSIQKLPENFKLAIVLREFQGLSYEEIAEITKTNVGTVKSRIARARTRLQQDLKKYIA